MTTSVKLRLILLYAMGALLLIWLIQALQLGLQHNLYRTEWFTLGLALLFTSAGIMMARYWNPKPNAESVNPDPTVSTSGLSKSEQEVLLLLLNGLSNAGIAEKRCLSVNTIKTQVSSVYSKLGVTGRRMLLAKKEEILSEITLV